MKSSSKNACIAVVFCIATAIASPAQSFTTLLNFDGADGLRPLYMSLVQGEDGNFYGTTYAGGANNNCPGGCGTVFKITLDGTLTTLHSFNYTDGDLPEAGLVQARNGDFFGTTYSSAGTFACVDGCGTVFKISASGALTTLHIFDGTDGNGPDAPLLQAADGNLYGTTYVGGAKNDGTVFKITPAGVLTTLYNFCSQFNCPDGSYPYGGLVQSENGDFYGTTGGGGISGDGTVFKITPAGTLTTLLSFDNADGALPMAGLVQGSDGNFYGTTYLGGGNPHCSGGCGTVFKITAGGKLTTLYRFDIADGRNPTAGLVPATDGSLYGTTYLGGAHNYGTVFKIAPAGTLTTLHNFDYADGADPLGGLMQATNGAFYGTTSEGGAYKGGSTIFSLFTGLGSFVQAKPSSGKAGAPIIILGNNLTGTTAVTFNGSAAAFTVVSPTEITTTVPAGATTGIVQVVTPTATLNSNVVFRVAS